MVKKSKRKEKSRKNVKSLIVIIIFIIIFIFLLSKVTALGISPAVKSIDVEILKKENEFTYYIINNEHKDLNLSIYASGELAEYIEIDDKSVIVKSYEEIKPFKWHFKKINDLASIPGKHEGKIIIEENLNLGGLGQETDTKNIYAKLKVISKVEIFVPYIGKYIDVNFNVVKSDETIDLVTYVINKGTERIDSIFVTYEIYQTDDNEEKLLELVKTEKKSLDLKQTTEFFNSLNMENFKNGTYRATATINYDNYVIEIGKDFVVGNAVIEILDYTRYFVFDEVNKFDIEAKSEWNKKIKNVYAKIEIYNKSGEIDELRSSWYDFAPNEKKLISTYWETKIPIGVYDINITLFYLNESRSKVGQINVITKESDLLRKAVIGLVTVFVITFIIFVFVLFYYFLSKRKNLKIIK
ncbi:MAG: hypothetical protein QW244_02790 [Candidatus Pacearchaeota archaeon]